MDFLQYLYRVASPFVMVSEIELAVRALIRIAMTDDQVGVAARRCLSFAYGSADKVPVSLEDMSFDNYRSLVSHDENWKQLVIVFGGTKLRTSGKLMEIGGIRNDLFHFRREITVHDRQTLATHRNWLLNKIKQAEARRAMETKR